MLLEVLRCCFSTSTGLGNLSHDATLVIASLCGSWVQQTAVGSVLLRIARLGCSARDRVAKLWLRGLYPQRIGDPYQMATGSGSSWSDYFRDSLTYRFGSDDSRQCSEPHRQGYACCRHAQSKHRRSPDPGACSGGRVGYPIPILNRATLLLGAAAISYSLLLCVRERVCIGLGRTSRGRA